MTESLEQIDEGVDERIRAGFASLRDELASSVDIDAALATTGTPARGRAWSRRSVRITAVAAVAAVAAFAVVSRVWPREVSVNTTIAPAAGVHTSPPIRLTPPTSFTPSTVVAPTVAPGVPTTTAVTAGPDDATPLIIGGRILPPGQPSREPRNSTPGSTAPDGSGCSPGGEDLPDGVWYGYLVAAADQKLELDVACRFSGDAAVWAIKHYEGRTADDWEERYVLNERIGTRPLPLDSNSSITDLASYGTVGVTSSTPPLWQEVTAGQMWQRVKEYGKRGDTSASLAAWVRITDGRVEWLDVSGDNYAG